MGQPGGGGGGRWAERSGEEACGLNYSIKRNKLQQQMACQFTVYVKLLDANRVVVKHMKSDSILGAYWVKCTQSLSLCFFHSLPLYGRN